MNAAVEREPRLVMRMMILMMERERKVVTYVERVALDRVRRVLSCVCMRLPFVLVLDPGKTPSRPNARFRVLHTDLETCVQNAACGARIYVYIYERTYKG